MTKAKAPAKTGKGVKPDAGSAAPAAKKAPAKRAKAKPPADDAPASRPMWPQHEKFVIELVATGLRALAYKRAYPAGKDLPDREAAQRAWEILAIPAVRALYDKLMAEARERAVIDQARVLQEIARVATSDPAGIVTSEGKLLLPHELDPDTRAALASFEIDEYGRIKYKFWDKNAALEKLARHYGLYEKDNAQQPLRLVGEVRLVPLKAAVDDDGA